MFRSLQRHLPLAIALVALICAINVPKAGYDLATVDPPKVPEYVIDESPLARGADLERGNFVGATPSGTYPRALAVWSPSPNWSQRGVNPPEAIVLHVTGPGTMAGMASWFGNAANKVSAHFGIGKDGKLYQYVEVGDAAWQAGNIAKPTAQIVLDHGSLNPNVYTVGIEVLLAPGENLNDYPAQKATLVDLLLWLHGTTGIPLDRYHVIGHNEIDGVNRSVDPVCCYMIDNLLREMFPPLPEWGATDESYGGRYNNWRQVWVSADGNWEFNPATNGPWVCVSNCTVIPPAAVEYPGNASGLYHFVTARFPLASVICAYDWPCGEALSVVYGPTPPNDRAPSGCPNGESSGNPNAGSDAFSGLWALGKQWQEQRFIAHGWTWVDARNPERATAIAHEIWAETGTFAQWSCHP